MPTWYTERQTNFSGRADASPVGAGKHLADGLYDRQGNNWDVSGGILRCVNSGFFALLTRATPLVDSRVLAVTSPSAFGAAWAAVLRFQPVSKLNYEAVFDTQTNNLVIRLRDGVAISYTTIASSSTFTRDDSHTYAIDFTATGTAPTTLAAKLFDLTTDPTMASAVATVAATTDNTTGLQRAGQPGIHGEGAAPSFHPFWSSVTTYATGQVVLASDTILKAGRSPFSFVETADGEPARPVAAGAYQKMAFGGATCALLFDVTPLVVGNVPAGNYPIVRYWSDEGAATDVQLTSTTTSLPLTLNSGFDSTTHGGHWELRAVSTADRWTAPAAFPLFCGILVDGGAGAVALSNHKQFVRPLKLLAYGDSITEGANVNDTTGTVSGFDAAKAYVPAMAAALNAEYGQIGNQGQGWAVGGQGNVVKFFAPGDDANSSWNKFYAGKSRLVGGLLSPQPDIITVMLGNNDNGFGTLAQVAASVQGFLTAVRSAAPSALVILIIPFAGVGLSQITAGFNAYQGATPDSRAVLVNVGLDQSTRDALLTGAASFASLDGLHPNTVTQGAAGAMLGTVIASARSVVIGGDIPAIHISRTGNNLSRRNVRRN